MQDARIAYDKLPYRSWPYRVSSPDHLSALAYLLGFDVPLASASHVLEIGCAAGNNLIPAAIRHPDSRFLGIDISPAQIALARSAADRLGLTNIEFLEADLRTFNRPGPPFDYIIAHGIFSWISQEAQRSLLARCRENVTPNGVIYISYNCYPGWKTREILRDAMLMRVRASPSDNPLGMARGMVSFLAEHVPADSPMWRLLDDDRTLIAGADDAYLAHDFLEEENNPVYLRDFTQLSASYGLRYLSDSRIDISSPAAYPASVAGPLLAEVGADQILFEQYIDFVVNRQLRQSLLVRDTFQPSAAPFAPDRIEASHFALTAPNGQEPEDPIEAYLHARLPDTVSFAQLAGESAAPLGVETGDLVSRVQDLIKTGRLHPLRAPFRSGRGDGAPQSVTVAPVWRAFARITAEQGQAFVVDAYHHPIVLDPVEACLIPTIDGEQTSLSMLMSLMLAVAEGRIHFLSDGQPVADPDAQEKIAADHLAQFEARLPQKFASILETRG